MSPDFAQLLDASEFALAPGGPLGGLWLDAHPDSKRPTNLSSMASFWQSRPRKPSFGVTGLFDTGTGAGVSLKGRLQGAGRSWDELA